MKKQVKRIFGILLAVALLLSCVPMAISVGASTAALPGASIKNGGFEKGDFTNWTTDSGAFSIDGSGWRGNYCLKATGSGRLNQTISVERNTDYKIEYINKLQTNSNTDQGIVEVYTKDFSNCIASGGTTQSAGWNTTRFTFNSGNRDEVIISIRGVKGTCWYDEIYILKSNNLLVNGDFSTATYARWVSGDDKNTTDAWCVQDDPFEEGGYCLAVGNGVTYSRKLTQSLTGLSTNSDYILTFYSKGCTASNGGQIKVTDGGENVFTNGNVSAKGSLDTWKKSTYKFNTGSNTNIKVFIQSIHGGTVYFDKIALVKATTATITADEGGTVSSDDIVSGSTELNSKMTVTATPSAGCTFAGWYNGNDELVSTDESYTFKVTSAVNLTAKFNEFFKNHSLVLAEEIGVVFYMDLSQLTEAEKNSSWMEFRVENDEITRHDFDTATINSAGYYGFICYISSVNMADTITPILHYSGNRIVGSTYTVKTYIDYVVANPSLYTPKVLKLVKALGDYGHYSQIYLGNLRTLTFTALEKYRDSDYTANDYSKILSELNYKGVAIEKSPTDATVTAMSYNLNFDAMTTLNVKVTSNSAISDVAVTVNEETLDDPEILNSGKVYTVRIPGLMITQIGDPFTVTGTAGSSSFTVSNVSGLSYIRATLKKATDTNGAKNAMAAFYDYYKAAKDYVEPLPSDSGVDGEEVDE